MTTIDITNRIIWFTPSMIDGFASENMDLQTWSIAASWIAGLLFVGLTGFEIYKQDATPGGRVARLIAVLSILSWVATAAGGRWIGFR